MLVYFQRVQLETWWKEVKKASPGSLCVILPLSLLTPFTVLKTIREEHASCIGQADELDVKDSLHVSAIISIPLQLK